MNLSLRILDPDQEALVDIGHVEFYGYETVLQVKAQVVDLDNGSQPYYIPLGSSVIFNFPGAATIGAIEPNRSVITTTLTSTHVANMYSGDISILITEPSSVKTAHLGNSVRRLTPYTGAGGTVEHPDIRAKVSASDTTTGYLNDEITVGDGMTKEIITSASGDEVIKLTSSAGAIKSEFNNSTGSSIIIGRIVKIVGDDQIEYANNTSLANAKVGGITLEEIADGSSGDVMTDGTVSIVLAGVSSGDTLYLDASGGNITNVPPSAAGTVVFKIGVYNLGKIFLQFSLVGIN